MNYLFHTQSKEYHNQKAIYSQKERGHPRCRVGAWNEGITCIQLDMPLIGSFWVIHIWIEARDYKWSSNEFFSRAFPCTRQFQTSNPWGLAR